MKKFLPCMLLFAALPCFAEKTGGFFAGASLNNLNYAQRAPAAEVTVQALEFNAGFWFHPLLSAEVRGGVGLGDKGATIGDTEWELQLDHYVSAYWRPEVGNDVAKLYALLGFTNAELTASNLSADGQEIAASESSESFGVGVGFHYTPNVTLNLEWKQLVDGDGYEIKGVTAGFDYRF